MSEHVIEWLSAYMDDELRGGRLHQVERHLVECQTCRAELRTLRSLSALLHEVPVPEFTSSEKFMTQVNLRLPRELPKNTKSKIWEIGWWLIPVGALGVWLFFQITFSLSSVVLTASEAGLLGNGLPWLQGNSSQTGWFPLAMDLFGGQVGITGKFILSALNELSLFIQGTRNGFIWQALLATLYLGWLASWWRRQSNQANPASSVPQS